MRMRKDAHLYTCFTACLPFPECEIDNQFTVRRWFAIAGSKNHSYSVFPKECFESYRYKDMLNRCSLKYLRSCAEAGMGPSKQVGVFALQRQEVAA